MNFRHEQVATFEENGYLIVEGLLDHQEVEELAARTMAIATGEADHFPDEYIELEPGSKRRSADTVRKLNMCWRHDEVFRAHSTSAKILDIVECLIGPDIKIYGSQLFMKPPGGVEKPYHQDSPYFPIEPMALVSCWAAIDDVTLENGCLWFVPGSHRSGVVDHSETWMVGERADMKVPDSAIDLSREQAITLRKGDCSFHHSLLLHRSGANQTPHRRRGLATHYMSSRSKWTSSDAPPVFLSVRGAEFPGCV